VDQSFKLVPEEDDPMAPATALLLGIALATLGPVVYFVSLPWRRKAEKLSD